MSEKILTVAIPSYNVEEYLAHTLDSFIDKEIMQDIEVFIVDDGSKDRTAEIGKQYEDKYPDTFRVISKENGGHGSAINRGIAEAKGKYFKNVDGDDWVNTPDFVKMVKALKTCDAEYVATNYYEVDDQTGKKTERTFRELQKEGGMSFTEAAKVVSEAIPMHAICIRTDVLQSKEIRLDEHCFYVDVEYILFPVPFVEKVEFLDLFVYMYRLALQTQSVSLAGYQKHIEDHKKVIAHLLEFMKEFEAESKDAVKTDYMAKRIALMVRTQVLIFISYSLSDVEKQNEFQQFDADVKAKNPTVYKYAGEISSVLRRLRASNFKNYKWIVTTSKIKTRITGNY